MIGSPAPEFHVLDFVKGEKIYNFERDRIYVIEFWATWCDPCLKMIPHLSDLQIKYPSVCIIGIATKESDTKTVFDFVKKNDRIINYAIAIDTAPESSNQGGWMVRNWCDVAYKRTIPVAFIVDAEGKIAWIGHPKELEEPLSSVINGSWDIQAATRAHNNGLILNKIKESSEMEDLVTRHIKNNNVAGAINIYTDFFENYPELEKRFGKSKLALLISENSKDIKAYANHLFAKHYNNSPKDRIAIGGMIANDVINLTKISGRSLDKDLVLFAYDILTKEDINNREQISSSSLMLLNGSLALILLALERPDDALIHAKIARNRAIEADSNYMLDVIDKLICECIKNSKGNNILH